MKGAVLKGFAPFADLSDAERAEIGELLEERRLSPGETLFHEGDDAEALVLIVEGNVKLSSRRAREKAVVGGGTVLGGFSLFAVGAREASAVGVDRAEVRLLRREDFLRLAEDSPRTAWRVAAALAAELAGQTRLAVAPRGAASVDPARIGE